MSGRTWPSTTARSGSGLAHPVLISVILAASLALGRYGEEPSSPDLATARGGPDDTAPAAPGEPATTPSDPDPGCTVLLYHKFDEFEYPTTNVDSEVFRAQMAHLRDEGYTVLPMERFRWHLTSGTPFPERSVLLTIDDPYQSIADHAWPILSEFDYPWTLFVWTDGVERNFEALMSWETIEALIADGVTIGNHSHTHPRLARPAADETDDAYATRISDELTEARRLLAARGIETDLYAYPYGEYNHEVVAAVRDAGFALAFAQDRGPAAAFHPRLRIPREAIVGGDGTLESFVSKLRLDPLEVRELDPGWGILPANPPGRMTLRLADPGRYDGVVNVFVSELGRVEADYDRDSGLVRVELETPLTRVYNRMLVSARDRETGRYSLHAHLVVTPHAR